MHSKFQCDNPFFNGEHGLIHYEQLMSQPDILHVATTLCKLKVDNVLGRHVVALFPEEMDELG